MKYLSGFLADSEDIQGDAMPAYREGPVKAAEAGGEGSLLKAA